MKRDIREVEVAIIGAGTAGLSALSQIRKATENYVIIEGGTFGTTCARVGCMPSKTLIASAAAFHQRNHFAELGISGADHVHIDRRAVLQRVRRLRDRFVAGVVATTDALPDHVIRGQSRFTEPNCLEILAQDGSHQQLIRAERFVLATGSSPFIPPPIAKLPRQVWETTDTFFERADVPERITMVGLGAIGIELGQALSRLGVEVRALGTRPLIGGLTDPELNAVAQQIFQQELKLFFGRAKFRAAEDGVTIELNGEQWTSDLLLVSAGRRPNLDQLGLEHLPIERDDNGIPLFNSETMQIGDGPYFIAGDMNGFRPLLHEAADEGRIAGFNAMATSAHCFRRRTPLAITFCEPNIASVGKTHRHLNEENASFVTGTVSYSDQGRARVMAHNQGALHIYADPEQGTLLGCEMVAPHGEHLAHLVAAMIHNRATVFDALEYPFYHPVLEEGLRTALRQAAFKVETTKPALELPPCSDLDTEETGIDKLC